MTLAAGTRLGSYQIVAPLGQGGMGEVYRARDTRLGRDVAVKVLPADFAASEVSSAGSYSDATRGDRRARFEREARTIAALNHPNICALYDVGEADLTGPDAAPIRTSFLVMELLEGETLADRLTRGALTVAEALPLAAQLADALDKAHRAGVVHRDLKPGNVMITRSGTPRRAKLLDFGLAKSVATPLSPAPGSDPSLVTRTAVAADPVTANGTILGTLAYMAPEQLEGRAVDSRTDIFAFGAVLLEMLTGHRAFDASSQAGIIGAILKDAAPLERLDTLGMPAISRLVRRCLAKDPDERWQSAGDLAREIEWIAEAAPTSPTPGPAAAADRPGTRTHAVPWLVAGALATAAAAGWWLVWTYWASAPPGELRLSVAIPERVTVPGGYGEVDAHFALSPDGRMLVFAGVDPSGRSQLWLRPLDSPTARAIPGTESGDWPFWSPDGLEIGFTAEGMLKRVDVAGGRPRTITAAQQFASSTEYGSRGTWGPSGIILFDRPQSPLGENSKGQGILRVGVEGGTPTAATEVTTPPNAAASVPPQSEVVVHRWPKALPDGRHFIYVAWTRNPGKRAVYLGRLDSSETTELVRTPFKAEYADPASLLYIRDGVLVSQKLSLDPPGLVGEPTPVVDDVGLAVIPGQAQFAASRSGVVAYRSRNFRVEGQVMWVDRQGRQSAAIGESDSYVALALSPTGDRLAFTRQTGSAVRNEEPPTSIFLRDLRRGVESRVSPADSRRDENPTWSPDGRRLAYASHGVEGGGATVLVQTVGAERPSSPLIDPKIGEPYNFHPVDWSRDGRYLLLHAFTPSFGSIDLWVYDFTTREIRPLVRGPSNESQGQFSPDGSWIAFTSDASGRAEVFLHRFAGGDERWQVSSEGGSQPRWAADGKQLFYVAPGGTLMSVPLALGTTFSASAPQPLFRAAFQEYNAFFYGGVAGYLVSNDGQRFLINRIIRGEGTAEPISLVLNWKRK